MSRLQRNTALNPADTMTPGFGAEVAANIEKSWWNQSRKQLNTWRLHEADPDYDPWQHLEGYEEFAPKLIEATSASQMAAYKKWIDDNRDAEDTLARGEWGIIAALAGGVVDPANLIPVPLVRGIGFVRGAATAAGANATITGATEAVRLGVDPTMEPEEILPSITMSALLGGVLGGVSGGFGRRVTKAEMSAAEGYDRALARQEYDNAALFIHGEDVGMTIQRGRTSADNFKADGSYDPVNIVEKAGQVRPKLGPDNRYYIYDHERQGWIAQYKSGHRAEQLADADMQKALGPPKAETDRIIAVDEKRLARVFEREDWRTPLRKLLDIENVDDVVRNLQDYINLQIRQRIWAERLPRQKGQTLKAWKKRTYIEAANEMQNTRASGRYGFAAGMEEILEAGNQSPVAKGIVAVDGDSVYSEAMLRLAGDYGWANRGNNAGNPSPQSTLLAGLRHMHSFVRWRQVLDEQWNAYVSGKTDNPGMRVLGWNVTASMNKYQRRLANATGNDVLTYEQFSDMVGQAAFRNDFFQVGGFDVVPEARVAARELNKVFDEYDTMTREAGMHREVRDLKKNLAWKQSDLAYSEHSQLRFLWDTEGGHPQSVAKAVRLYDEDGSEVQYYQNADGSVHKRSDKVVQVEIPPAPELEVPARPQQDLSPDLETALDLKAAMKDRAKLRREAKLPKRPMLDELKARGGVQLGSPLAAELRALGVNSQTAPGLFHKNSGMRSADTIVWDEVELIKDNHPPLDNTEFADPQDILDAVGAEMGGDPVLTASQARAVDDFNANETLIKGSRRVLGLKDATAKEVNALIRDLQKAVETPDLPLDDGLTPVEQQRLAQGLREGLEDLDTPEPAPTPDVEIEPQFRSEVQTIDEEVLPPGSVMPRGRKKSTTDQETGKKNRDAPEDHDIDHEELRQIAMDDMGMSGFRAVEQMRPEDTGYLQKNLDGDYYQSASQLIQGRRRSMRSPKQQEILARMDADIETKRLAKEQVEAEIKFMEESAPAFRDDAGKAEHFFPRYHKNAFIIENREHVTRMLQRWFEKDGIDGARARAEFAVDDILDMDDMSFGDTSPEIRHMRRRMLEIPNSHIYNDPELGELKFSDIIDTDALRVAETYIRRTGAKVEVAKTFGDPDMEKEIARVKRHLTEKGVAPENIDEAIGQLELARDAVTGRLRTTDPWRWDNRTGRALKMITAFSSMGRSAITAIPEMMRGGMINGFATHFDGVMLRYLSDLESVREFKDWYGATQEMAEMAMENANVRQAEMQMGEKTIGGTWFERQLEKMMPGYFKLVGLTPWTAITKDMMGIGTGHMVMARAIRVADAVKAGKRPSQADLTQMAALGIGERDMLLLAEMPYEMSPNGKLIVPAVKGWKGHNGRLAQRYLLNAMQGEMRRGIVTPSVGDKPLVSMGVVTINGKRFRPGRSSDDEIKNWRRGQRLIKKNKRGQEWTKQEEEFMMTEYLDEEPNPGLTSESDLLTLPFQFLGYGLAAHNKLTTSALQGRDQSPVMGILAMTMLGVFSTYMKVPDTAWQSMELEEALMNGYEAAGISGFWFGDLPSMIERASGSQVGIRPLLGIDPRYNKDSQLEGMFDVAGAAPGMLFNLSQAFLDEDLSATQRAQIIRRVVPYANVLWWNGITRNLATSAGKVFEE